MCGICDLKRLNEPRRTSRVSEANQSSSLRPCVPIDLQRTGLGWRQTVNHMRLARDGRHHRPAPTRRISRQPLLCLSAARMNQPCHRLSRSIGTYSVKAGVYACAKKAVREDRLPCRLGFRYWAGTGPAQYHEKGVAGQQTAKCLVLPLWTVLRFLSLCPHAAGMTALVALHRRLASRLCEVCVPTGDERWVERLLIAFAILSKLHQG